MKQLIERLNLQPHPEGGYYRQTFKSNDTLITPERYQGSSRQAMTAIYYLLHNDDFSAWHKIKSDELWIYLHGTTTATLHTINTQTNCYEKKTLGAVTECQANSQLAIPFDTWFAVSLDKNSQQHYALFCCVVAPGFEFDDFTLANQQTLISEYPQYASIISYYTRT